MDVGGGNFNYGWAQISVADPASSITITGFAFQKDLNVAILAGDTGGGPVPVPEPGQVAASMLLLAGIAGYFALRRRAGASTEPNGLHSLALGARGIEEFRKNKAA
jgi:hypothetical protein